MGAGRERERRSNTHGGDRRRQAAGDAARTEARRVQRERERQARQDREQEAELARQRRKVHMVDQKQEDRRANRSLLRRTIFLMAVFGVALFIPLGVQLWKLQVTEYDQWTREAAGSQTRDVPVSANRGSILDASGRTLAMSATTYNLILSPQDLVSTIKQKAEDVKKGSKNYDKYKTDGEVDPDKVQKVIDETREEIAGYLVSQLGLDRERVESRLQKNSRYEVMAYYLEDEEAQPIREFISEHRSVGMSAMLYLTPTAKRYYPQSTVGAHILGYVGYTKDSGDEKVGKQGLELVYNDELSGLAGRVVTAQTGRGFQMLSTYENYMDAEDGRDLTLTMDTSIQSLAEQMLQEGTAAYDVQKGGIAIVMDPNTGAIYAMASTPDFDPNNYDAIIDSSLRVQIESAEETYGEDSDEYKAAVNDAYARQWRNKALSDAYEPGSTFKPLVVAAALEEGVVSMNDTFYCSGATEIGGHLIHCHKRGGHGSQTLTGVLENSCNCGMMEIAQRLGAEKMWQYFEDYGLMSYTGIDLAGEGKWVFWDENYFKSANGLSSLAVASFGQTFKVTPIRMITSFASVINGGHLVEPYLVDKVSDGEGNTISYHETQEVRQVLSESTSAKLREMLESVVANGTGKNAYMAGYRIGGKTGTSEKRDELDNDDVIVSFMGFAPADDPKVVVLVAFDSPKRSAPGSHETASRIYISGGNMAAPIVGQLIAETLDYLGVEKQYTADELSGADTVVPSVVGSDLATAEKTLSGKGLKCRTVGDGAAVTGQIPSGGLTVPGGSTVILYMGEAVPEDQVEVPNLAGMTPAKVKEELESRGLFLRGTGVTGDYSSGVTASTQSIEPGTMVSRGAVLEVHFVSSVIDYAYNT